jgi:ferritin-like metal-binding protein YciE
LSPAKTRTAAKKPGHGREVSRNRQDATLRNALIHELEDLYDADDQLVGAFRDFSRAAEAKPVSKLCREGIGYTKERVRRLDRAFASLGATPRTRRSDGMRGLIRNARKRAVVDKHAVAKDIVLTKSIQQISFYGLSGYSAACSLATALGEKTCLAILRKSLSEKRSAVSEEAGILKDMLKRR